MVLRKNLVSVLPLLLLVGVLIFFHRNEPNEIELASTDFVLSTYANVPCPDQTEITRLTESFHLEISFKDFKCEANDTRTFLLKTLKASESMNIQLPPDWDLEAREIFADIGGYLKKHLKKVVLSNNPETSTMVGTNPGAGYMELTHRLKELTLIEAVSMLVHEVRHIQAPQRGHSRCAAGDMPGTDIACDEVFTDKYGEMASYNFEVTFLAGLAMYSKSLTVTQRQYAAQRALSIIATRFNNFKNKSAFFYDVLVTLNSQNQIHVWHPLLQQWLRIPIEFGNDHPVQIEAGNDAYSLYIFTELGKFYSWNAIDGIKPVSSALKNENKIKDGQRIIVPALRDDIVMTFIQDGKLKMLSYGDGRKQNIVDYPFVKPASTKKLRFKKMVYGFYNELYLISEQGRLFRANRFNIEPDLTEIKELNLLEKWISGTGGLLYDKLYFINEAGNLYDVVVDNKKDIPVMHYDESLPESFKIQKVHLPFETKLIKYVQGSFGDYYLNNEGDIIFKSLQTSTFKKLGNHQILDMAVIKSPIPQGRFAALFKVGLESFMKKCNVDEATWDPILLRGQGINLQNKLVVMDLDDNCLEAPTGLIPTNTGSLDYESRSKFDESLLKDLTKNGANFRSVPLINFRSKSGTLLKQIEIEN